MFGFRTGPYDFYRTRYRMHCPSCGHKRHHMHDYNLLRKGMTHILRRGENGLVMKCGQCKHKWMVSFYDDYLKYKKEEENGG